MCRTRCIRQVPFRDRGEGRSAGGENDRTTADEHHGAPRRPVKTLGARPDRGHRIGDLREEEAGAEQSDFCSRERPARRGGATGIAGHRISRTRCARQGLWYAGSSVLVPPG
jgi:hypothetical protein